MELAVLMNNKAPGTTLLSELVAKSVAGSSLTEIAEHLAGRAEFTSAYPTFQTATEFANEWLANALPEASASLLAECVPIVEGYINGGGSIPGLVVVVQEVLTDAANADGALKTHVDNFANKVTVATYHTITSEAADEWTIPATVTSDATTVATANAAADTALAPAPVPAKVIALTTGLDTGAAFTGAATDDTFNSVNSLTVTSNTLTAGDNLSGGEGTDTLRIVASGGAITTPLVSSSSVEVLDITNNSGNNYSIDTSLMTGLAKVNALAGNSTTTVTASATNLNIAATSTNQNIVTTSAVPSAGAADAITIDLSAAGTTAATSITSDGIETFNVNLLTTASGSTTPGALTAVTLASNQLENVNIAGSVDGSLVASLAGASAFGQVGTVDASTATGNVTINVTPGGSSDGKTSVSMGSGDDKVTIGALDKDYTITGGDGTDTLVASATAPGSTLPAASYVGVGVSGFEKVDANGGSIDFRSLANNTTFVSTEGAGTYAKAGAGIVDSFLPAGGALTLTRATDGAADSLNVHITQATAATVTASLVNEETITVASAGTGSAITHSLGLTVTDATKLNVIGSNALNITSLVGETALATIDAGTHTGQTFTVNASGSAAAMTVTGSAGTQSALGATVNTITTGSGADKVTGGNFADTLTTGTGNDSVDGGAGNDTLTTNGGNDTAIGGDGDDTITTGTGSDSIVGGAGNDVIDAGSGSDTVDAGAGTDQIVVTLNDSTNVDGGAGTDRVSAATGTITSTTAASVSGQFITVTDSIAPTLTGVESLHITLDTTTGTAASNQVNLDLTSATSLASLFMDTDDGGGNEFGKVTNFAGTSATLYGGDTAISATNELDNLTFDGVGQAAVALNLQGFLQPAAGSTLTLTGIQGLTIAADSTSQLTGSADQDNFLGIITANGVTSLAVTSSGSATTNAAALTTAAISATGANAISLTSGAFDDFDITGNVTAAAAVETAAITVGTDSQMTLADVLMPSSTLLSANITVNDGGFLSNSNANVAIAAAEAVDITASSIADLNVTVGAGAIAALDLRSIGLTDADMTVGASSNLVLGTSLGLAGAASNIKISGRGDLDDTDDNAIGNEFNILGTTVTFDMAGLTTDTDNTTITTAATVKATIKTGLGDDVVTGSVGADSITTNAGADTVTGGAGADTLTLGTGTDIVLYSDVTGATSHSLANLSGVAINLSATAVTAATIATAMGGGIVIGGGAGVAGADLAAGSAGYLATSAGNSTATMVRDSISGAENVTGSALGDYIVGGATAGIIGGGAGIDVIIGGAGADTITGGAANDTITGGTGADEIRHVRTTDGTITVTDLGTTDILDLDTALRSDNNSALDYTGFNGTQDIPAAAFLTLDNTDLAAATGFATAADVVLEIGSGVATVSAITVAAFETAFDTVLDTAAANDRGTYLFIAYDGTTASANAGVFYVDFATATGGTKALEAGDTVNLIAVLQGVGADAVIAGNFI
jgi:hypothetical protein